MVFFAVFVPLFVLEVHTSGGNFDLQRCHPHVWFQPFQITKIMGSVANFSSASRETASKPQNTQ